MRPVNAPLIARPVSPAPVPVASHKRVSVSSHTVSDTLSDNMPELINCLCSVIKSAKGCNSCLGMLVSTEDYRRHLVWLPKQQWLKSPPEETRAMTLDGYFSGTWEPPSPVLRLKLGVKLASSVMQLHGSQWLNEAWGGNDICFIQDHTGPRIDKPLVYRSFSSDTSSFTADQWLLAPALCNRTIFCLGITLIELCYWKPFANLHCESVSRGHNGGDGAALGEADQFAWLYSSKGLWQGLEDSAGAKYAEAIRRCIFGFGHKDTGLEDKDFKNEVYWNIVHPLEENLRSWCDEQDLDKIFSKTI